LSYAKYTTPIKRHDTLEKQDSIHLDGDMSWALFGYVFDLPTIVSPQSEEVALDLRGRSVRVTDFGTRGGDDRHLQEVTRS
jgi:hypothetical protein